MRRATQLVVLFALTAIAAGPAIADKHEKGDSDPCTVTVYIDADIGARKKGGAKRINKSHQQFEARGYHFVDMEIYLENADMEGFFVTYAKSQCKADTDRAKPDG